MTKEGARAKDFFAAALGWTYGEMPGVPGGYLIRVDGKNAGALMDLDVIQAPHEMAAHIGVMMRVESCDAAVARIEASGGSSEAPFDVMANGRMAMCKDPNGAVFGLWQPMKEVGFEADSFANGAPTWFETPTSDVPRAVRFYADVFGWQSEERPMPGMTYTLLKLDDHPIAGTMPIVPQMGPMSPCWATCFAVDDAQDTVCRAAAQGATVCFPVTPIPDVGLFAVLRSPQGVDFSVMQFDAAWRGRFPGYAGG